MQKSVVVGVFISLLGTASAHATPPVSATATSWKITRAVWTDADEKEFEDFVRRLGEAKCNTVESCLRSEANPYRFSDPAGIRYYADCADLPYFVRTYFAWKKGLPFSYVSDVSALGARPAGGKPVDVRYSPIGNAVTARYDVTTPKNGPFPDAIQVINRMEDTVSTAMYRMPPQDTGANCATGCATRFSDQYPVKVNRQSIRPGTTIYDPNGHVAMVYKVSGDGRVFYIDAHPDNSMSRGVYGKKFVRSHPGHGAGFKLWRPLELVGAERADDGTLRGGRVVARPNRDLTDFSLEQLYGNAGDPGNDWRRGRFLFEGTELGWYDFLRAALTEGKLRFFPLTEFGTLIRGLCADLRDRAQSVQLAIGKGIAAKPHPERLPRNIYGAEGEWEDYATPARDAQLRTQFGELLETARSFIERQSRRDLQIEYSGTNLAADLLKVWDTEAPACRVSYRASSGKDREMNLVEVERRLYRLSFDPYHCVERRWGATSSPELATCGDSANKIAWYDGEQFLRNRLDRNPDEKMGFDLAELRVRQTASGEAPRVVDIRSYLVKAAK